MSVISGVVSAVTYSCHSGLQHKSQETKTLVCNKKFWSAKKQKTLVCNSGLQHKSQETKLT